MSTDAEYTATNLMYEIMSKLNICDYYVNKQDCNHCILTFENIVVGIDAWKLNMMRVLKRLE